MKPLFAMLLLAAYAPQRAGNGPLADPVEEQRAISVGHGIRCAVCQGLSVADSPSPMAQAMLDRVRELVHEGKSDEEIRAYFVARYGEWILLEPKPQGLNLLVWILPFVFVGGGLWVIARKARPTGTGGAPANADGATTEDDEYLRALRDEVEGRSRS